MRWKLLMIALVGLAVASTGCSNKKLMAQKDAQIDDLQAQVNELQSGLQAEKDKSTRLNDQLDQALADLKAKQKVWMDEKEGLTHITLDGEATFPTASAELTAEGKAMIDKIWSVVSKYPDRAILIEGHTDNRKIAPSWRDHYRSNWELSTARANAVLHYVLDKFHGDPNRVAAVGYGPYHPITSNDTAEGRKRNRRVVITIGSSMQQVKAVP